MHTHGKLGLIIVFASLASACADKHSYNPPLNTTLPTTERTIGVAYDALWEKIISNAGKKFFVVNNIDKPSGFINISYSGDPRQFVDCGTFETRSSSGELKTSSPLARKSSTSRVNLLGDGDYFGDKLIFINELSVDGRANIIVKRLTPTSTNVAVAVKYVVQRRVKSFNNNKYINSDNTYTTDFVSGGTGYFSDNGNIFCVSTGEFEAKLLSLLE